MRAFRSLLFVPADRTDRVARALASGADAVCLDLEDAVAPDAKADARRAAERALALGRDRPCAVGVRVNALGTDWWRDDLSALAARADFIMLPKAAAPADIATVADLAPGIPIWPLVESASGLRVAWAIAETAQVAGVLFGGFDYAADVGCAVDWEPLLFARGRLAAACAAARVQLLDSPAGDYRDLDALAASTRRARALGCTGRACIHPAQVAVVNAAYTPGDAEVAHARRVLAAFDAAAGSAAQLDGRMIDLPVARAARRVLAQAGE